MIHKEVKRKCQGCFDVKDRNSLIKITKLSDGRLKINPSSKELGRSIYICKNLDCIKLAIKKKRIKQALKYSNQEEILKIENELLNFFN